MIEIILENFVTLCLIIGLTVLIFSNRTFDKRSNYYFMSFIAIILILDITDMIDCHMIRLNRVNPYRYITSAISYTLRPATLTILINILLRRRRFNIIIWFPVIIIGVMAFTNSLIHILFDFHSQNEFITGSLAYASHLLGGIYMLMLMTMVIQMHQMIDLGEVLIVSYSIAICTVATLIEDKLAAKFLLPGAMTISCALYYIFLYVQTYKRDVLTGAFNRRTLYADVERIKHQHFIVISMDLNGLKEINDSKGHQCGDNALRLFTNECLKVGRNEFRIYRTGGDEFIALGKGKSVHEAEVYINKVKKALEETPYTSSFGYAQYTPENSFDEVCNQADAKMYANKIRYKQQLQRNNK